MLLIAVRHGETEWNVEGREMGQLDSPLTTRGIRQAEALAERLSLWNVDALYSSDLGRAVRTAEIVGGICGLTARIDPGLRERHMGVFQGLTTAEIAAQYPTARLEYEQAGFYDVIPEGESNRQKAERSGLVLTQIAMRHREGTVAVITHAGILRGFVEFVLRLPPDSGSRFKRYHASFNAFDHDGSMWSLRTWNDVSHLHGIER